MLLFALCQMSKDQLQLLPVFLLYLFDGLLITRIPLTPTVARVHAHARTQQEPHQHSRLCLEAFLRRRSHLLHMEAIVRHSP